MILRGARRAVTIALWVLVVLYAARAVHDFYSYVDSAIYLAADDSEANISYALAKEGRYGFLASPVLVGMPRNHGQFNYGPWYFAFGAALIWLFGYSLTLLRSIHLLVILGTIGAAAWWFRGMWRVVPTTIVGFGLVFCFGAAQWPMVRPDPMVSAFAVAFVVAAGRALARPAALAWLIAGAAAGGAALTHLIAWAIVPAAIVVFGVSAWRQWRKDRDPHTLGAILGQLAAFAIGGLAAAVMFYASFGFDLAGQLRFFSAYQEVVTSEQGFMEILARHWNLAFGYLPDGWRWTPLAILVTGLATLVWALRGDSDPRRLARASLLPPVAIWAAYSLSLGSFPNFHLGYTILTQLMMWWVLAALVGVMLQVMESRGSQITRGAALVVAAGVVVCTVILSASATGPARDKLLRAHDWVPISEYTNHVINSLPAGATALGTVMFGVENPDRVQLVQLADALALTRPLPAEVREQLTPEYLVWGYPEVRDSTFGVMTQQADLFGELHRRFPDAVFVPIALVNAVPYGTTRVYGRLRPGHATADRRPAVRVFNSATRQWHSRVGEPSTPELVPVTPAAFRVGYEAGAEGVTAAGTVAADVPRGVYLLRIDLTGGAGAGPRMIAVTSEAQVTQVVGELGPDGAFVPYLETDVFVDVLVVHRGGRMLVSQIDAGSGASLGEITLQPVLGAIAEHEAPQSHAFADIAAASWQPVAASGTKVTTNGLALAVTGDASQYGYQVLGPRTETAPRSAVTARINVTPDTGQVCVGVLNLTEQAWLVAPTQNLQEYSFVVDRSGGFRLVVSNCNRSEEGQPASRFIVEQAAVSIKAPDFYADRLIEAWVAGTGARQ